MSNSNLLIRGMVSVVASIIATAGIISFYEPFYQFTIIIGVILICLFSLLFYWMTGAFEHFSYFKNQSGILSSLFILVFPILLMISSAPDQSHLEKTFEIVGIYFVTYFTYVILFLALM